ncbi:MAG: acetate kinase [Clostridia bacterium]|nr:acetate kinase [Clostridia bacterium]
MKILVINAGSSSLKYQLINMEDHAVLAKGQCDRIGVKKDDVLDGAFKHVVGDRVYEAHALPMADHKYGIEMVLKYLTDAEWGVIADASEIDAVGHRVVNGGEIFPESCIMDEEKIATLETLTEFAPLHNPPAVTGIRACIEVMGENVPQICVFDTSFHQTMPKVASVYALPYEYYSEHGIRRFGAHGTSHKYVAAKCAEMMGKDPKDLKIVTCHLGNGSSITAVDGGKCVDTSMGFTPLAGLLMGTRCGDIDPAILPFIMKKFDISVDEIGDFLNKKCGVLGVSGVSSDFRDLDKAADEGNERAQLALDMFNYQIVKYIGSYAAVMGGIDAIVFTAGVGENNPIMREAILDQVKFLGVEVDSEANNCRGKAVKITTENSRVAAFVIPTNEELAIALDTERLVNGK